MNGPNSFLDRWSPCILSVLRIIVAFLFMAHGGQKILNYPAPAHDPFNPTTMGGIAGILELFGGLFLLLGLGTRLVSFLLSGEMAVAYFKAHAPQGFWPLVNKGELAVLYCFIFFYFVFVGGGTWSIDNLIARNRRR